jgi:polynucleotide 5'-hydroxyl-kinase GRC3/NOL9
MKIVPEPEWEGIGRDIARRKGVTLLIGATDSGKSTLARHLTRGLLSKGIRVSLVDSDIGQSSLGMPGTISMKVFKSVEDMDEFKPDEMFFIGDYNPARKIPLMIEGTRKMVDIARGRGAKAILIDTTGLIGGNVGRVLKVGKIRAIRPAHIIAIQRRGELEGILSLLHGVDIRRLKVSPFAKKRRKEERNRYRIRRYAEYFKGSRVVRLPCEGLEFIYKGREVDAGDVEPGRIVGLNRGGDTTALGIFKGVTKGKVVIKTPLKPIVGIDRILIGDVVF